MDDPLLMTTLNLAALLVGVNENESLNAAPGELLVAGEVKSGVSVIAAEGPRKFTVKDTCSAPELRSTSTSTRPVCPKSGVKVMLPLPPP